MKVNDRLVWIELVTSGPDPDEDRIERIATVVTDKELAVVAELGPLAVTETADAEAATLEVVKAHVGPGVGLIAGTRVQDVRSFLAAQMPALFDHLHYRNVDVTTVRELVRRWYPEAWASRPEGDGSIAAAVTELRHYRATAFRPAPEGSEGSEDAADDRD
ncbi:MAG: hypothetical protein KC619_31170 [Myxococcales bacterium]|nr:hypothetical protein [Myxococcales bacterium]